MKSTPALLLASSLLMACTVQPPAETAKQAEAAKAEDTKQTEAAAKAAAAKKNELTPEELELIEADPKTLTPDQNRKRAYALRKKVMQNPDSDAAKTLEDMQRAVLAGEIEPQIGEGKKKDEGLVIPAPSYLRSDEQAVSHDEPADQPDSPDQPGKPAGVAPAPAE